MLQRVLPVVILVLLIVAGFGFGSRTTKNNIEIKQSKLREIKNKLRDLLK